MAAEFATPEKIAFFLHHTSGVICAPITARAGPRARPRRRWSPHNTESQRTAFLVTRRLPPRHHHRHLGRRPGRHHPGARRPGHPARRPRPARPHLPARGPRGRRAQAGRPHRGRRRPGPHGRAATRPACCARSSTRRRTDMARLPELERFAERARPAAHLDRRPHPLPAPDREARPAGRRGPHPHRSGATSPATPTSRCSTASSTSPSCGATSQGEDDVLVRVHSECLTGDVFGSLRCDCGPQLDAAMQPHRRGGPRRRRLPAGPRGPGHRHRPQDPGLRAAGRRATTPSTPTSTLGLPVDSREYGIGAQILVDLGITTMRLHDQQPGQVRRPRGLRPRDRRAGAARDRARTPRTSRYLRTKRERMGHLLEGLDDVLVTPREASRWRVTRGDRVRRAGARRRRRRAARRRRVRPVQRPRHAAAARRRARAGLAALRRRRRRRRRGVGAGRLRDPARRPRRSPTSGRVDAVIASAASSGARPPTTSIVAGECAAGIQQVQLDTGVPVVFGVLTTENLDQALARSEGAGGHNVGEEARRAAVEMARRSPGRRVRGRLPDAATTGRRAEARPAQGLAREGHPRAVRGGRPRASRRSSDGRLQGDHRRPPRRRRAHPAPAGDPAATWPRASSTSASPAGTGSRRPASDVVSLGELQLLEGDGAARSASSWPCPSDSPCDRVEDLPDGRAGVDRVPRAHPALLRRSRASRPTSASPTAPPRPRSPTSSTASSTSPRPAGRCGPPACKIIDTILTSYTELIANPAAYDDPDKRHAMDQLHTLLDGVLEARGKVLVKLNVGEADLDAVIALAAVDEVADGLEAVRRRRLRGRDGGRRRRDDQHADPRAQGRRRHRHHRAPARPRSSTDVRRRARGTGRRRSTSPRAAARCDGDDGTSAVRSTAPPIADGTRTIEVGHRGATSTSSPAASAAGRRPGSSRSDRRELEPSRLEPARRLRADPRRRPAAATKARRSWARASWRRAGSCLAEPAARRPRRRRPWRRWRRWASSRSGGSAATGGWRPARRGPWRGWRRPRPRGHRPGAARRTSAICWANSSAAARSSGVSSGRGRAHPARRRRPGAAAAGSTGGAGVGRRRAVDGMLAPGCPEAHVARRYRRRGRRRRRRDRRPARLWTRSAPLVPYGGQLQGSGVARRRLRPGSCPHPATVRASGFDGRSGSALRGRRLPRRPFVVFGRRRVGRVRMEAMRTEESAHR